MSLTVQERAHVARQLDGRYCENCGGCTFRVNDDGVTPMTGWGVGGAYVLCDECECELDPPEVKP